MIRKSISFLGFVCFVVWGSVACVGVESSVDVDEPASEAESVRSVLIPKPQPEPGPTGVMCGGIASIACPEAGLICVDDPNDNCSPAQGGSDCAGICATPDGKIWYGGSS